MRLILFGGYFFGKMWKNMEKRPFFRAAMAGLGKYHMGGYGRIGVYRVNVIKDTRYGLTRRALDCLTLGVIIVQARKKGALRGIWWEMGPAYQLLNETKYVMIR